ncbi:MAG TPA: hypothetical protein VGM78_02960, partial [Ilumatobacteraceae bacterium]
MAQSVTSESLIDGHGHEQVAHRPLWKLALPTIVCLILLTAASVASGLAMRTVVHDNESQRLAEQSTEVSALLGTGLGEVHSALTLLSSLTGPRDAAAFQRAATSLLTGNVRTVAAVTTDGTTTAIAAATGDAVVGQQVTGDRQALVQSAMKAPDVVAAVLHVNGETRLAYALHSSTTPTVVVFRETKITPEVVAATVRGQAFGDVKASLYAAPNPDLSELVLSTATPPQITGQTIKLTIGADTWLLVTNARGALVTGWLGASPWIVFASGMLLTLFDCAFVETVVRRRGYALALVDERTADLRSALAERSALEAGQRLARQEAEAASHAK